MEKHTFEIKETVIVRNEKIEVTFPHFRKYEFFSYKVLNKDMQIQVSYYPHEVERLNTASISHEQICIPNTFRKGSYEITEEEFNETFLRAIQLINNQKN